jgi:hypothetical protein
MPAQRQAEFEGKEVQRREAGQRSAVGAGRGRGKPEQTTDRAAD